MPYLSKYMKMYFFVATDMSKMHTKTRPFKYIENFTSKYWKFSDKNSDIFLLSAQNIGCGYSTIYDFEQKYEK